MHSLFISSNCKVGGEWKVIQVERREFGSSLYMNTNFLGWKRSKSLRHLVRNMTAEDKTQLKIS